MQTVLTKHDFNGRFSPERYLFDPVNCHKWLAKCDNVFHVDARSRIGAMTNGEQPHGAWILTFARLHEVDPVPLDDPGLPGLSDVSQIGDAEIPEFVSIERKDSPEPILDECIGSTCYGKSMFQWTQTALKRDPAGFFGKPIKKFIGSIGRPIVDEVDALEAEPQIMTA